MNIRLIDYLILSLKNGNLMRDPAGFTLVQKTGFVTCEVLANRRFVVFIHRHIMWENVIIYTRNEIQLYTLKRQWRCSG